MDRRSRFIALCLLLAAGRAHANDSVMGGSGSDLVPIETTDVSMVSEDIQLTFRAGDWHVEADYVFRNAADRPLALQLGFPEYRCPEGDAAAEFDEVLCVDRKRFRFANMRTEVRGQLVTQRKGKLAATHAWAPRLGTVWLFDVEFAAGESVQVRHTYSVPSGYSVDGSQTTTYVTRTGALWAGPIGSARFRVRVPFTTSALYEPDALPRAQVRKRTVDGVVLNELVYEARDWVPTADLSFGFRAGHEPDMIGREYSDAVAEGAARAGLPASERCESFLDVWRFGYALTDPQRDQPSDEDVAAALARGVNSKRICQSAVAAIHGRRFEDDALNRYFYGEQGFAPRRWPPGFMQPNADYDPSWLGAGDRKAIELFERLPPQVAARAAEAPAPSAARSPAATATRPPAPPVARQAQRSGCGCAAVKGPGPAAGAWALALAGGFALRRRKRARLRA